MTKTLTIPLPVKPCPFCGNTPQLSGDLLSGNNLKLKCKTCKVRMYEVVKNSDTQTVITALVKRWNNRNE